MGRWLLAADVGGTHTRIWVREPSGRLHRFEGASGGPERLRRALAAAIEPVPARARRRVVGVLAVAGPVHHDRARLTNLGWYLDARAMSRSLGVAAIHLLHDVSAAAHGISRAPAPRSLTEAPADPHGPLLLVLLGTGVGVALRHPHAVIATEAGHVSFAPRTPRQQRFLDWLRTEGVLLPTLETVAAGPALPRWYRFLGEEGVQGDPDVAAGLSRAADPAAHVGAAARSGRCPRAVESVRHVQQALGHALRDLALVSLPRGGILLGGGVPHRLAPLWEHPEPLLSAYQTPAPMDELVRTIPIGWLDDPDLGLRGAMARAEALSEGTSPCHAPC